VSAAALALVIAGCACSADENDDDSGGTRTEGQGQAPGDIGPPQHLASDARGFYTPPDPLPHGEPGQLLRYQPIPGQAAPDVAIYRVMYLSTSVQDDPIAVTGLVVVPKGEAPTDGRTIVSVAHGTTGLADRCAPSRLSPQFEAWEHDLRLPPTLSILTQFAQQGYVVAATDYEGLGTPGVHPYLVGESEGRSVLDAARAARQLPDARTGNQLGIWGYSQGGHAALWAQQLAGEWAPQLDLVGTVAGAPGSNIATSFSTTGGVPSLNNRFVMIVAGFAAAYPDARPDSVLTDAGLAIVDDAEHADACGQVGIDTSPAGGATIARPGFAEVDPWPELLAASEPGQAAVDAPLLLLHSEADRTVPIDFTLGLADRLCSLGQRLELRVYDLGEGHVEAVDDAVTDGLAWIDSRVAGTPAPTTCR